MILAGLIIIGHQTEDTHPITLKETNKWAIVTQDLIILLEATEWAIVTQDLIILLEATGGAIGDKHLVDNPEDKE